MIVTKDNFAWVDVTPHASKLFKSGVELFVVHDDHTESLIEYEEEIGFAIREKLPICMEGGHLNPKISWDKNAHRIKVNGYWYTKISDTKLVF